MHGVKINGKVCHTSSSRLSIGPRPLRLHFLFRIHLAHPHVYMYPPEIDSSSHSTLLIIVCYAGNHPLVQSGEEKKKSAKGSRCVSMSCDDVCLCVHAGRSHLQSTKWDSARLILGDVASLFPFPRDYATDYLRFLSVDFSSFSILFAASSSLVLPRIVLQQRRRQ